MPGEDKYKILIIEDSLLNMHILQRMLQEDYGLTMVTTAEAALQALQEYRPDLILLDIILPNYNGFDLLEEFKQMERVSDIPVIIITGLGADEDEERGFLLGAVDYIRKPFKETVVNARINTQIRIIKQIQTIEKLSLLDVLTGVPNRRHFENQSQYEWGRAVRENYPLSLMMIDVDHFKSYNDTHGHPQGDCMLKAIGQMLKEKITRSVDMLCRYGGEEFVVMLPNTDLFGAKLVAERLRDAIESLDVPNRLTQQATRSTISIGLVCARPQPGVSLSGLVETADQLLYQAKRAGRNRVETAMI